MRVLPKTDAYYPPLLLVRTDYRDDAAWQRVRAALDEPWGSDRSAWESGRLQKDVLCVDDPAWADAAPSDVLAALLTSENGEEPAECEWAVVFLADRAGTEGAEPTLLAVSADPEETTAPFRVPAVSIPHEMHCNLTLANMDFHEFDGIQPF